MLIFPCCFILVLLLYLPILQLQRWSPLRWYWGDCQLSQQLQMRTKYEQKATTKRNWCTGMSEFHMAYSNYFLNSISISISAFLFSFRMREINICEMPLKQFKWILSTCRLQRRPQSVSMRFIIPCIFPLPCF